MLSEKKQKTGDFLKKDKGGCHTGPNHINGEEEEDVEDEEVQHAVRGRGLLLGTREKKCGFASGWHTDETAQLATRTAEDSHVKFVPLSLCVFSRHAQSPCKSVPDTLGTDHTQIDQTRPDAPSALSSK